MQQTGQLGTVRVFRTIKWLEQCPWEEKRLHEVLVGVYNRFEENLKRLFESPLVLWLSKERGVDPIKSDVQDFAESIGCRVPEVLQLIETQKSQTPRTIYGNIPSENRTFSRSQLERIMQVFELGEDSIEWRVVGYARSKYPDMWYDGESDTAVADEDPVDIVPPPLLPGRIKK